MRRIAMVVGGMLAACTKVVAIPIAPAELPRLTARSAEERVGAPNDEPVPERYEVENLAGQRVVVTRPFGVALSIAGASFAFGDPVRASLSDGRFVVEGAGRPRLEAPLAAITRVELQQRRFDGRRTVQNVGIVVGIAALCAGVLGAIVLKQLANTH